MLPSGSGPMSSKRLPFFATTSTSSRMSALGAIISRSPSARLMPLGANRLCQFCDDVALRMALVRRQMIVDYGTRPEGEPVVVLAGEDHITRPGVFEELCPSDRVPFARIGIAATNNPKAETSMRTIGVSHLHPEGSQYHLILLMKIIASIK
jgi:hypothetical protein